MGNDRSTPAKIAVLTVVALLALIVIGAGITAFSMYVNRNMVNPQERQNQVEDPSRSIANRQFFHNEISSILSTDRQIDAANQALTDFKAAHPRPWDDSVSASYDQTYAMYQQLQQIRDGDIGDYNSASSNPDIGRDRDSCLPKHIDATETVASEESWIALATC